MEWRMSDYQQMQEYIDYRDKSINHSWIFRALQMAKDMYAPYYYFPPVPMDPETFFYLRRN